MNIHKVGSGPDLVMLHGWGMNSAVWQHLVPALAQNYSLHLVDLPGHGQSSWRPGDLELDVITDKLANQLPPKAFYLAWSLGGLIATTLAQRFPERVNKLLLIAVSPCFVQKPDWRYAVEANVFNAFSGALKMDQADTLKRFLLLQARGSMQSRKTIEQLATQLANEAEPIAQALEAGLQLLIETDLRGLLTELSCPMQFILGERDTLIPIDIKSAIKQLNPAIKAHTISGAGHAPFISHPDECQQLIECFLNE